MFKNVKDKVLHLRIPAAILKKYRMLCLEKELSIPKQTAQLIESFCKTLEMNKEYIK